MGYERKEFGGLGCSVGASYAPVLVSSDELRAITDNLNQNGDGEVF